MTLAVHLALQYLGTFLTYLICEIFIMKVWLSLSKTFSASIIYWFVYAEALLEWTPTEHNYLFSVEPNSIY